MSRICSRCKKDETAGATFSAKSRYCRVCAAAAVKESRERTKKGITAAKNTKKSSSTTPAAAEIPEKTHKKCAKPASDYTEFCGAVNDILAKLDKNASFAELLANLFSTVTLKLAARLAASTSVSTSDSSGSDEEEPAEPAEPTEPEQAVVKTTKLAPAPKPAAPEVEQVKPAEPSYSASLLDSPEMWMAKIDDNIVFGTAEQIANVPKASKITREKAMDTLAELADTGKTARIFGESRPLTDDVIVLTHVSDPLPERVIARGKYYRFYNMAHPHVKTFPGWSVFDGTDKAWEQYGALYKKVEALDVCPALG